MAGTRVRVRVQNAANLILLQLLPRLVTRTYDTYDLIYPRVSRTGCWYRLLTAVGHHTIRLVQLRDQTQRWAGEYRQVSDRKHQAFQ